MSLVAILVWSVPSVTSYTAVVETQPVVVSAPVVVAKSFDTEIARLSKKYGQSEALARKIISCESQYSTGSEHKNYTKAGVYWSSDWGYWQINDYYNEKTALRRGFNIYDRWENLEYGFIMLREQGTTPWNASRHCWQSVS